MDRVRALVEKLNTQLEQNEAKASLLLTAQQLLTELGGAVSAKPLPQNIYEELINPASEMPVLDADIVSVNIPDIQLNETTTNKEDLALPKPTIETTSQVAVEATTNPSVTEVMTSLATVNTDEKIEVKDHLVSTPIKDLRSAIGINDKFQFIQDLFGGDEKSFEDAIKTINSFKIFPEAQFYIKRELREKNNWDEGLDVVKQFDQLVKRRFS